MEEKLESSLICDLIVIILMIIQILIMLS